MKIAVPITGELNIDNHFGHCEFYGIFTVNDKNEITDKQIFRSAQGCGCKSNIAGVLAAEGVSIMLAGGIGEGAINVLNASGIKVIRGCSGSAESNVIEYIAGNIVDSGSSCSSHNHGEDGHTCNH